LPDGACQAIVQSYQLHLGSQTELRIQVQKLQSDNAYLLKVVVDKKAWFTWMEVLNSVYHQFFFTANSLERQPTTSQFFKPLTPQTLALVAAAIHCALSEYATGKKVTVMFSQDEY
jgi:ureidoglycolate hydrolase